MSLDAPEDGWAEELELAAPEGWLLVPLDDGAALELDEELGLEGCVVEPAPAEPLMLEEPEDGAVVDEDEEPPLALSFFWMSIEVDEELEPEGAAGAAVVPEAELEDEGALGEVVAPEPEGEVVVDDEELAPAGARDGVSDLLQPAISAPPNARETARARVENFMGPPWLGQ